MASLNPSVFAELNMGAAEDFDGIAPISLTNNFAGQVQQVENNFDQAGLAFSGMTNG
ncbi:MAG: hypothetical protein ACRBCK_11160 [Alphaproteobacteria bacterium]